MCLISRFNCNFAQSWPEVRIFFDCLLVWSLRFDSTHFAPVPIVDRAGRLLFIIFSVIWLYFFFSQIEFLAVFLSFKSSWIYTIVLTTTKVSASLTIIWHFHPICRQCLHVSDRFFPFQDFFC